MSSDGAASTTLTSSPSPTPAPTSVQLNASPNDDGSSPTDDDDGGASSSSSTSSSDSPPQSPTFSPPAVSSTSSTSSDMDSGTPISTSTITSTSTPALQNPSPTVNFIPNVATSGSPSPAAAPSYVAPNAGSQPSPSNNSPTPTPISLSLPSGLRPATVAGAGGTVAGPSSSISSSSSFSLGPSSFQRSRRPSPTNYYDAGSATTSTSTFHGALSHADAAKMIHISGIVTCVVVGTLLLLIFGIIFRPALFRSAKSVTTSGKSWTSSSSRRTLSVSDRSTSTEKDPGEVSPTGLPPSTWSSRSTLVLPIAVPPTFLSPVRELPPLPPIPPRLQHTVSAVFSDSASFHVEISVAPPTDFDGTFPSTPPMHSTTGTPTESPEGSPDAGVVASEGTVTPHGEETGRQRQLFGHPNQSGYLDAVNSSPGSGRRPSLLGSPISGGRRTLGGNASQRGFDDDDMSIYSQQGSVYSQQTLGSGFVESTRAVLLRRANATRMLSASVEQDEGKEGEAMGDFFPTTPLEESVEAFYLR
ncbi:hypothetical protein P7C70_g5257, partial [Phenoliferia sp. Uapishka_3]